MLTTTVTENTQNLTSTTPPAAAKPIRSKPTADTPTRPIFTAEYIDDHGKLQHRRDPRRHYALDGYRVLNEEALSDEAAFRRIFDRIAKVFCGGTGRRTVIACDLGKKMPQFYNDGGMIGIVTTASQYLICRTYDLFRMVVVDAFSAQEPIETSALTGCLLKLFKPVSHSLCRDIAPSAKFLKQTVALCDDPLPFSISGQQLIRNVTNELQLFLLAPSIVDKLDDETYTAVQLCAEGHLAIQATPLGAIVTLCAHGRISPSQFMRCCTSHHSYSIQRCSRLELT